MDNLITPRSVIKRIISSGFLFNLVLRTGLLVFPVDRFNQRSSPVPRCGAQLVADVDASNCRSVAKQSGLLSLMSFVVGAFN